MDATHRPVISATGLFTPPDSISNDELVASFNAYVARHNAAHAEAIAAGEVAALAAELGRVHREGERASSRAT